MKALDNIVFGTLITDKNLGCEVIVTTSGKYELRNFKTLENIDLGILPTSLENIIAIWGTFRRVCKLNSNVRLEKLAYIDNELYYLIDYNKIPIGLNRTDMYYFMYHNSCILRTSYKSWIGLIPVKIDDLYTFDFSEIKEISDYNNTCISQFRNYSEDNWDLLQIELTRYRFEK